MKNIIPLIILCLLVYVCYQIKLEAGVFTAIFAGLTICIMTFHATFIETQKRINKSFMRFNVKTMKMITGIVGKGDKTQAPNYPHKKQYHGNQN